MPTTNPPSSPAADPHAALDATPQPAPAVDSAPSATSRAALALQQALTADSFARTSLRFDLMGQHAAPQAMRLKLESNLALVTTSLRRLNTELDRNAFTPAPGTLNLGDFSLSGTEQDIPYSLSARGAVLDIREAAGVRDAELRLAELHAEGAGYAVTVDRARGEYVSVQAHVVDDHLASAALDVPRASRLSVAELSGTNAGTRAVIESGRVELQRLAGGSFRLRADDLDLDARFADPSAHKAIWKNTYVRIGALDPAAQNRMDVSWDPNAGEFGRIVINDISNTTIEITRGADDISDPRNIGESFLIDIEAVHNVALEFTRLAGPHIFAAKLELIPTGPDANVTVRVTNEQAGYVLSLKNISQVEAGLLANPNRLRAWIRDPTNRGRVSFELLGALKLTSTMGPHGSGIDVEAIYDRYRDALMGDSIRSMLSLGEPAWQLGPIGFGQLGSLSLATRNPGLAAALHVRVPRLEALVRQNSQPLKQQPAEVFVDVGYRGERIGEGQASYGLRLGLAAASAGRVLIHQGNLSLAQLPLPADIGLPSTIVAAVFANADALQSMSCPAPEGTSLLAGGFANVMHFQAQKLLLKDVVRGPIMFEPVRGGLFAGAQYASDALHLSGHMRVVLSDTNAPAVAAELGLGLVL